jgi:putative intracellular protease/amidase
MPKILMVLTSHGELDDSGLTTGYYVSEAAHPYAVFKRENVDVDFASPSGGQPPATGADPSDPVQAAFLTDPEVHAKLRDTYTPSQVDCGDYDAILFVGGHGAMFDFADNTDLQRITREIWQAGGVVSAICHGPAALVNVTLSDGSYLIAGKTMAAFTDDEERATRLDTTVPFLLASALRQRGAHHTTAPNFQAHIEVDDRLVTGQNPASATPLAEAVVRVMATVAHVERPQPLLTAGPSQAGRFVSAQL